MVHEIHAVPGRLRVKIQALKSNPHAEEEMTTLYSGLKGIGRVSFNPITGSVVITYDPNAVEAERILNVLKAKGYLKRSVPKKALKPDRSLPKTRVALGRALFGWAMGNLLQNTGLSFLTVLI
jgi:hypothetical protein